MRSSVWQLTVSHADGIVMLWRKDIQIVRVNRFWRHVVKTLNFGRAATVAARLIRNMCLHLPVGDRLAWAENQRKSPNGFHGSTSEVADFEKLARGNRRVLTRAPNVPALP